MTTRDIWVTGLTGGSELITTYPIDYLKTLRQAGHSNSLFWSNPYRGMSARLAAILPVRFVFWGSYNISRRQQLSPFQSAIFMGTCETLVDFPPEQVKVRRMLSSYKIPIMKCFNSHKTLPSLGYMFARNTAFIGVYHSVYQSGVFTTDWNAPISGVIGSIVSHPFDTLKTTYQSGSEKIKINWKGLKLETLFHGCGYRCLANFIGMGIGDFVLRNFT
jgi:hypothetical protein